jgi:hypothetical protein
MLYVPPFHQEANSRLQVVHNTSSSVKAENQLSWDR